MKEVNKLHLHQAFDFSLQQRQDRGIREEAPHFHLSEILRVWRRHVSFANLCVHVMGAWEVSCEMTGEMVY